MATALRGVKGMVKDAASSMKGVFKDALGGLGIPLSIGGAVTAVVASIRSLMEYVQNLKRISESTGLSTGVTQDLLNLGKAAGVASDQVEQMMDKFVQSLAPGSDPEQALMEIADKMKNLHDPVERAQFAMENFGKSGAKLIPILEQGSDGVRKMSEEWGKLDEAQIREIEHANQVLEQAGNKRNLLLAHDIEGAENLVKAYRKLPFWQKLMPGYAIPRAIINARKDVSSADDMNGEVSKALPTPAEINKAKMDAAAKAAHDLAQGEEFMNAKPQEKVLMLTRQILELRRQMEDATGAKQQEDIAQKILSIEKDRKGIEDQISEKKKQDAQKEKDLLKEINEEKLTAAKLQAQSAYQAQYGTLQEVANSGFLRVSGSATVFQQGPLAAEAQRVEFLEARAHRERIFGNKDAAESDESLAGKLRKDLEGKGAIQPTMTEHLKSISDNSKAAADKLNDLDAQFQVLKKSQE